MLCLELCLIGLINCKSINIVEMGGVEPPSKQRAKRLSTRLVVLWLSAAACRKTG